MPIRVVLFDLGGVLLPFDRDRRIAALAALGDRGEAAARALMAGDLALRLDLGQADVADLTSALSDYAGRPVSASQALSTWLSVFQAPNLGLWSVVERLRSRARVGGFSDNPRFVREVFPPGARLDPLFLSCELGVMKPDPRAFAAVAASLGDAPDEILFVDDGEANVAAGRAASWDAFVHRTNDETAAELARRGLL